MIGSSTLPGAWSTQAIRRCLFSAPLELSWAWRLRQSVPEAVIPWLDGSDDALMADPVSLSLAIGERLSAAVTHCSGAAHLLANVDVPLVTLYGPTDPARFLPWTPRVVAVRAADNGRCGNLGAITIDDVSAALAKVLGAAPPAATSTLRRDRPAAAVAMLGE